MTRNYFESLKTGRDTDKQTLNIAHQGIIKGLKYNN